MFKKQKKTIKRKIEQSNKKVAEKEAELAELQTIQQDKKKKKASEKEKIGLTLNYIRQVTILV